MLHMVVFNKKQHLSLLKNGKFITNCYDLVFLSIGLGFMVVSFLGALLVGLANESTGAIFKEALSGAAFITLAESVFTLAESFVAEESEDVLLVFLELQLQPARLIATIRHAIPVILRNSLVVFCMCLSLV